MRVGIIGSGFGLYGYLPALRGLGQTPVMPLRYRAKMMGREDVRHLADAVQWAADERDLLERSEALIVAQRPSDQAAWVESALLHPSITRYHLEKPPAQTPAAARSLLQRLQASGKGVRFGFLFRFTPWADLCRKWIADAAGDATLTIRWTFSAHHYRTDLETWKRRPSQGGGVIRFYAIHLIGFLAELGYDQAIASSAFGRGDDDLREWRAVLRGPGLPECELAVDSDAATSDFSVQGPDNREKRRLDVRLTDPFDEAPVLGGFDRRLDVVTQSCQDFIEARPAFPSWYFSIVDLWEAVEAATEFQGLPNA